MPAFRFQRCSSLVVLFPIVSSHLGCAQSTPTTAELVAREIAVLEIAAGGAPLTPAERKQVAGAVAGALRDNPEALLRNYAALTQPLERAARERAYAAGLRRVLRYAAEENMPAPPGFEQLTATERQVVRAHDPTVVFDPARKHIVTEANLRDFRTASGWLARDWNLPPPTADFTAHIRDWFRASFVTADKDTAQVLATQGESFPFVAPGLAKADPKAKEAAILEVRRQLQAADPASRDLGLATVVAVIGAHAERQAAEDAKFGSLCTGPGFNAENTKMCRVLLGSVLGLATVRGINNADVFAHDLYHQPPLHH